MLMVVSLVISAEPSIPWYSSPMDLNLYTSLEQGSTLRVPSTNCLHLCPWQDSEGLYQGLVLESWPLWDVLG